MAYWKFNVERVNALEMQMRNDAIAVNSLVCSSGDLIHIDWSGIAQLATTGDRIDGVALNNTTFSSTNQTVEFQKVDMIPSMEKVASRKAPVSWGSITTANIGNFFDITATQDVDFTTASASTGVVRLIQVYTPTSGEFVFTGQWS